MTKTIKQSELNRLAQQLHDLQLALRPFSEFYSAPFDDGLPRDTPVATRSVNGKPVLLKLDVFRRAYEVLNDVRRQQHAADLTRAEDKMIRFPCESDGLGKHSPIMHPNFNGIVCSECLQPLPWICRDCFVLVKEGRDGLCKAHR